MSLIGALNVQNMIFDNDLQCFFLKLDRDCISSLLTYIYTAHFIRMRDLEVKKHNSPFKKRQLMCDVRHRYIPIYTGIRLDSPDMQRSISLYLKSSIFSYIQINLSN